MNKIELIEVVARKMNMNKREASAIVVCIFGTIKECLQQDESINIGGFGEFKVKKRAGRLGVKPKTGERIQIPESKLASFRPSKKLKDLIH